MSTGHVDRELFISSSQPIQLKFDQAIRQVSTSIEFLIILDEICCSRHNAIKAQYTLIPPIIM